MSKTIWRVEWVINDGKGPSTSLEFTNEAKAIKWAEGLLKSGGKGIVVTELNSRQDYSLQHSCPAFPKIKSYFLATIIIICAILHLGCKVSLYNSESGYGAGTTSA